MVTAAYATSAILKGDLIDPTLFPMTSSGKINQLRKDGYGVMYSGLIQRCLLPLIELFLDGVHLNCGKYVLYPLWNKPHFNYKIQTS